MKCQLKVRYCDRITDSFRLEGTSRGPLVQHLCSSWATQSRFLGNMWETGGTAGSGHLGDVCEGKGQVRLCPGKAMPHSAHPTLQACIPACSGHQCSTPASGDPSSPRVAR